MLSTVLFLQYTLTNRPIRQAYVLRKKGVRCIGVTYMAPHWALLDIKNIDEHFDSFSNLSSNQQTWTNEIDILIAKYNVSLICAISPPSSLFFAAKDNSHNIPVVCDYEDTLALEAENNNSQSSTQEKLKEIEMLSTADGVMFVGSEHQKMIELYFGLQFKKSLCLPNYSLNKFIPTQKKEKLSSSSGNIHVVYVGGTTDKGGNCYNIYNSVKNLVSQGIHVHIYSNNSDTRAFSQLGSCVHIEKHLPYDELLAALTQFDFGSCLYNESNPNDKILNVLNPNKFYDYLNAGLPVLISPYASQLVINLENTDRGVITLSKSAKEAIFRFKLNPNIPLGGWVLDTFSDPLLQFLEEVCHS